MKVLFVAPCVTRRTVRLAMAAKLAGIEPHITHQGSSYQLGATFLTEHYCHSRTELMEQMVRFDGDLVHLSLMVGSDGLEFVRKRPCPLVVDIYDTLWGIPGRQERDHQRMTLVEADGIIYRDLRVPWFLRSEGCRRTRPCLFQPDLIEECLDPVPRESDKVRVVSVGWIGSSGGDNSLLRVIPELVRHGLEVVAVLNSGRGGGEHCDPYYELADRLPGFTARHSFYGQEFLRFLQTFDFGLAVVERFIWGEPVRNYSWEYLNGCGSARVSDYIQAGLGVISSPELYWQYRFVSRYAPAVVTANRDFMSDPLTACRSALALRRPTDRKRLTIQSASSRLGTFYQRVMHAQ